MSLRIRTAARAVVLDDEGRVLLVTPAFEPMPRQTWEQLNAEWVTDVRWWTIDEIAASDEAFAPTRLAPLLRELLRDGPPAEPVDVGV